LIAKSLQPMIQERILPRRGLEPFISRAWKTALSVVLFSLVIGAWHFVFAQYPPQNPQPSKELNGAAYAAKQVHGMIGERFMDEVFARGGWTKLNSKIGPQGIDGLFIKKSSSGTVTEVMVVESKFGSSRLSPKQMTDEWISNNADRSISQLEKRKAACTDPKEGVEIKSQLKEYRQVKEHIQRGKYRERLCHVSVKNGKLIITFHELVEENGVKKKGPRSGKLIEIDLSDPPTERKLAGFYRDYFDSVQKELEKQLAKQGLERSGAKKAATKITKELMQELRSKKISNTSEQYAFLVEKILEEKINITSNEGMRVRSSFFTTLDGQVF